MSCTTTNYVRKRRDLTPAEFAVAYAMASHANPKSGKLCTAAVRTIAEQSGMEERSARRIIRRLEDKNPPVIFARTNKTGGHHQQTVAYEFNTASGDREVPREEMDGGLHVQGRGTLHAGTGDPPVPQKKDRKRKEKEEAVATAAGVVSQEQMDKELSVVWDYYLEATGRDEVFSSSKKRMGLAIMRRIPNSGGSRVVDMTIAIDMACHIVKKNSKKAFLSKWTSMFSKWNTFASLHQEYQETSGVRDAAQLPDEYLPPPPSKAEPTPEKIARKQEEQRQF